MQRENWTMERFARFVHGINLEKWVDVYDNLDRFGAIECHHLPAIFGGASSIGDIEKSIFSGPSVRSIRRLINHANSHALPEISPRLRLPSSHLR